MNAIANPPAGNGMFVPHPTHKLRLLLKREFWEHKGGFFWAPLVASVVFLVFTVLGGGTGQVLMGRNQGKFVVNGQEVPLSQLDLDQVLASASPRDLEQMHQAINGITAMSGFWPLMVFGFVVFFYFLGALYDERKDRSVLFWKSLPVSDRDTVLSKVLMGLVVGPLIAVGIALATMIGFGIIISAFIALNGGNPFTLYWAQLDPLRLVGGALAWLPIYVVWALPTAGWLLLCSAWAKSKPFLWAILLPLGAGILAGWFNLTSAFGIDLKAFWQHVVARLLTSAWPLSHITGFAGDKALDRLDASPDALFGFDGELGGLGLLTTPSLWIGAIAGLAMILAAIRLRRWRDEG